MASLETTAPTHIAMLNQSLKVFPHETLWCLENSDWSDFASSVLTRVKSRGEMTPRQAEAIRRTIDKMKKKKDNKKRTDELRKEGQIFLPKIEHHMRLALKNAREKFAAKKGFVGSEEEGWYSSETRRPAIFTTKMPKIMYHGIMIYFKRSGKYAGFVGVGRMDKQDFDTSVKGIGFIDRDEEGKPFRDSRYHPPNDEEMLWLQKLERNPAEEIKLYGQATGICSVCGRTLTRAESIQAGIGPICEENFGFG